MDGAEVRDLHLTSGRFGARAGAAEPAGAAAPGGDTGGLPWKLLLRARPSRPRMRERRAMPLAADATAAVLIHVRAFFLSPALFWVCSLFCSSPSVVYVFLYLLLLARGNKKSRANNNAQQFFLSTQERGGGHDARRASDRNKFEFTARPPASGEQGPPNTTVRLRLRLNRTQPAHPLSSSIYCTHNLCSKFSVIIPSEERGACTHPGISSSPNHSRASRHRRTHTCYTHTCGRHSPFWSGYSEAAYISS